MPILILLLLIVSSPVSANCTIDNISGDQTCTEGNISYVYPSQKTLNARAIKQSEEQAIIEAKEAEQKKQASLDELDRKSIRSLRAVLSAQAEGKTPDQTDLNTLKALEAQAKTIRGRK